MDKEEILNKVLKILALFCELRPEDINMDDRLQSDLYLGETQILDVLFKCCEEFHIDWIDADYEMDVEDIVYEIQRALE